MKEKTILIIGGGIAGMAAGCYGQMNGYGTQIFELHDLPGGLCTAWQRKEYLFDGCIHYLFGSAAGQPFHPLWEELGAVKDRTMINHTEFMQVISPEGKSLIAYCDPDRLEAHMKELSPGDARVIEDLAEGIRKFTRFDMSALSAKPRALMNLNDWRLLGQKMMPYLSPLLRWGMESAESFAKRFQDPFLRQAFPHLFGWSEIPMMAAVSLLASMQIGNASFPAGGSLEFARSIERRYIELGGVIHYKSQVEKILVEGGRAVGVRLYNDEVHRADYVISAADGHGTLFDLLGEEYINRKLAQLYDGHLPTYSMALISLGVNRDLSHEPHWATYLLEKPLVIIGEERHEIGVKHYCFDPSLAPAGKSIVEVMLRTNYTYWQHIYGHKLYDTEQSQVSDILIDFLEKLYPGISSQVEVIDEATPLSYERYTGNWQGSTTGWLLSDKTAMLMLMGIQKTLPQVKNFYMAGQWVEPGGSVPLVALSGRNAVQMICHADGQTFTTTTV
jgi:phytoene dehydrogenase-like protein